MKKQVAVMWVVLVLLLSGCGQKNPKQTDTATMTIYEVNKEETKISARSYDPSDAEGDVLIARVLEQLSEESDNPEMKAAIADEVKMNQYLLTNQTLIVDFNEAYYNQSKAGEVLSRAAIVKTLTQIEGVRYVLFTVNGNPLNNGSGQAIGTMEANQFVDHSEDEMGAKEQVNLTLYYSNEQGDGLVKVNRKITYSSNISLEKLVVEQLISGVNEEDPEEAYSAINPDVKIISVLVSDGVCYVNLDSAFLSQVYETSPEVTIYSIVNSLVELPDINKVQISVNGNSEILFLETLPLEVPFERNLELVKE